jgi:hypothetical protein
MSRMTLISSFKVGDVVRCTHRNCFGNIGVITFINVWHKVRLFNGDTVYLYSTDIEKVENEKV